jgi:hypothetical protein
MRGKLASWTVALVLTGSSLCAAQQTQFPATPAARGSHYIEFRVAQIGTYGHSYVAYGRLDARGSPAEFNYADLYPNWAGYLGMALGHVLPVPANTEWNPDVAKLPVASVYRRKLTSDEYKKLVVAVRRARANRNPYWNGLTNNCNHFVAELALSIGLRVPSPLLLSYVFVPALRDLNETDGPKVRAEGHPQSPAL